MSAHPLLRRCIALSAFVSILTVSMSQAQADERPVSPPPCDEAAITAHVLEQFSVFGPRSQKHEYFGFIYFFEGAIVSAVTRSSECRGPDSCKLDTVQAARAIPRGAKVLG